MYACHLTSFDSLFVGIMSLGMIVEGPINISFLTQGAFNKLYDIITPKILEDLFLRVTLPVDPRSKTLSEVATMAWVQQNTNIPVTRVIAYEASSANPVGIRGLRNTRLVFSSTS